MATASSSPADTEISALVRAHAIATLVAGAAGSLFGTLVCLQVLTPGILGNALWLGVGRLRFAYVLIMLFGWLGNTLAICVYFAFPWTARTVTRLGVGALKLGVWNLVITAPLVVMALAGILPPARVLPAWLVLGGVPHSTVLLSLVFPGAMLMTVRLWLGIPSRPFGRAFAMIIFGAMAVMIGGIGGEALQGATLRGGGTWLDGLAAMRWTWIVVGLAQLVLFWGCLLGGVAVSRPANGTKIATSTSQRWAFALGVVAILVWPFTLYFTETLDANPAPSTASEQRGRSVFIREGCATCHGNEGYRGIGPDLSRESGVRPADWHFTHLFNPRAVAPLSIMPSYAHLFTGAADQPNIDARDLVAYLESLGRARDLGAPMADATAVHPAEMSPARARRVGAVPAPGEGDRARGMTEFATYCVGCHGPKGEGDGPGAAGLRPKPANLAAHRYTNEQIVTALWNGVAGTAMPAWRDQPLNRIAMLAAYVGGLGPLAPQPAVPDGALELGARVYAANCTQCHGERGGGDGFSAASLPIAPANFQRQQPTLDYALQVLASGVPGTPMAPWTSRLNDQELLAVAHYVRSFYTGSTR